MNHRTFESLVHKTTLLYTYTNFGLGNNLSTGVQAAAGLSWLPGLKQWVPTWQR